MAILPLTTQLDNRTDHQFQFDVHQGDCPVKDLAPGGTQSINQARIIKCCRVRRSPNWMIRVLIDRVFTGMYLDPRYLLWCTKIVFEYERKEQGWDVLVMRGSLEKGFVDYPFRLKGIGDIIGRNNIWNKRHFFEIAQAHPRWNKNLTREIEDDGSNIVEPLVLRDENTIQLREAASSSRRDHRSSRTAVTTSPPQHKRVRRRSRHSSTPYYAAQEKDQKIPYHAHILLLVLSFSLVAVVHFLC